MPKVFEEKSERGIIEYIRGLLQVPAGSNVIKGIGDDCAVLRKEGDDCFLVTTDTLIAGVHFDLAWHSPFLLGRKCGAVNISDVAAMGGKPRFALLSLAFPGAAPAWLDDFLAGFLGMLKEHDTFLVGGDTVKSASDISFTVTVIGEAAENVIRYRSGAVENDLVFVSGCLGNAAGGLALCRAHASAAVDSRWKQLCSAHLDPSPQVQLGRIMAESGLVHAMMDISDGLATDLAHICTVSGTGAEIVRENIPLAPMLETAAGTLQTDVLEWALKGGEDYELLFTVAPEHEQELRRLIATRTGREIYHVGRIIAGQGVYLCSDGERKEISYQGYDHFGA